MAAKRLVLPHHFAWANVNLPCGNVNLPGGNVNLLGGNVNLPGGIFILLEARAVDSSLRT